MRVRMKNYIELETSTRLNLKKKKEFSISVSNVMHFCLRLYFWGEQKNNIQQLISIGKTQG